MDSNANQLTVTIIDECSSDIRDINLFRTQKVECVRITLDAFLQNPTMSRDTCCLIMEASTCEFFVKLEELVNNGKFCPFLFITDLELDAAEHPVLQHFFFDSVPFRNFSNILLEQRLQRLVSNWRFGNDKNGQYALYLTALLNESTDSIYFKDLESRFLMLSKHQINKYGKGLGEVIGKTDFDIFSDEHAQSAYEDEQNIIKTGTLIKKTEKETWVDREDTYVSTMKAPLKDFAGNTIGTFGISRDVTEKVKMQQLLAKTTQELKKSQKELIRSNRELEEFAYVASHDLQEPLRKISAFGDRLNTMASGKLNEKEKDYLDRMLNSSRRMSGLINDLLKYSRISTKTREFEAVDLDEIVNEVLYDLEFALEKSGGKVEVVSLPCINGDPVQMRQLFQNLIGNSLKFCREAVPPIVKITHIESNGEKIVIQIEDNGIGFESEYGSQIFKVFQRLNGANKYPGSGIGLSICKKIMLRHKGDIVAQGEPGRGSIFTITFPFPTEGESVEPQPNPSIS